VNLDAAIIGAGPAGVAAALSLRQLMPGAAIAIFDSGTGARWRPGEILIPGAASILQSLGCWPAFLASQFLESFGTRAAWGAPEPYDNEFLFSLHGSGWRLDRTRFDDMLRECARSANVEIHDSPLLDSSPDALWRLQFRGFECHSRFVIDASGRSAAFAVQRGARRLPDDRLAAVVTRFEMDAPGDTLIEAVENGWWYSATVPGSTAVVALMTDTDLIRNSQLHLVERWNQALSAAKYTQERLRDATPKGPPEIFTAHSQHLSMMSGPGWVAAGDAAMTFDPLSSQGILKALRSGKLASFAAADFLLRNIDSHQKYAQLATGEYAAYEKAKFEYYAMEARWPDAPFWKRRRPASRGATPPLARAPGRSPSL
jgi:flavin-dependent dehydrogenase